jgi:hypothetical protein
VTEILWTKLAEMNARFKEDCFYIFPEVLSKEDFERARVALDRGVERLRAMGMAHIAPALQRN